MFGAQTVINKIMEVTYFQHGEKSGCRPGAFPPAAYWTAASSSLQGSPHALWRGIPSLWSPGGLQAPSDGPDKGSALYHARLHLSCGPEKWTGFSSDRLIIRSVSKQLVVHAILRESSLQFRNTVNNDTTVASQSKWLTMSTRRALKWPRSSGVGPSPCPTPSPSLSGSSSPPSHAPSGLPGSVPGAPGLGPTTIMKHGCMWVWVWCVDASVWRVDVWMCRCVWMWVLRVYVCCMCVLCMVMSGLSQSSHLAH